MKRIYRIGFIVALITAGAYHFFWYWKHRGMARTAFSSGKESEGLSSEELIREAELSRENLKKMKSKVQATPSSVELPKTSPSPGQAAEHSSPRVVVLSMPSEPEKPQLVPDKRKIQAAFADIDTSMGVITIKLDMALAPKTALNFIELVEGTKKNSYLEAARLNGKPFYDGLLIFRVIKDHFIQMGDPENNGRGGPGYLLDPENLKRAQDIEPGMVIMATNQNAVSGSQFFIALQSMTDMLVDDSPVFGRVASGLQVAKQISEVQSDLFSDKPINEIVIKKIGIRKIYSSKSKPLER